MTHVVVTKIFVGNFAGDTGRLAKFYPGRVKGFFQRIMRNVAHRCVYRQSAWTNFYDFRHTSTPFVAATKCPLLFEYFRDRVFGSCFFFERIPVLCRSRIRHGKYCGVTSISSIICRHWKAITALEGRKTKVLKPWFHVKIIFLKNSISERRCRRPSYIFIAARFPS